MEETARFFGAIVLQTAMACGMPAPAAAQASCRDTIEGRICTVQQPIVAGALVPVDLQRTLGLVTLSNGCSGTLVNRYWVLTADHCLATDGQIGGPEIDPAGTMRVSATWSAATPAATRFVRFGPGQGLDVALVFLGEGDFGAVNRQLFFVGALDRGMTITKYGRGISAFATGSGPTATPAVADGQYRTARFVLDNASARGYSFRPNAGQIANGGDSGGPDIVTGPNGVGLGISGVQSTCVASGYVPGMPQNWNWATGITSCASAAIADIRFEILQAIQEVPGQFIGTFAPTPANFSPVFLYAVRNDGALLWYRQDNTTAAWSGPRTVGTGWQGFREVLPVGGNSFFALAQDGQLTWYRHDGFNDGTFNWTGPRNVGVGWTFAKVFSGSDGIVYGIAADGTLNWYRNTSFASGDRAWQGPRQVGTGWAGFKDVFSAGDGVIYAVTFDGRLLWYRHDGHLNGTFAWTGPFEVGSGWQNFRKIIPAGNGVLLALGENGAMSWYRHTDYRDGTSTAGGGGPLSAGQRITPRAHWEGPIAVGRGWQGFRQIFAIVPSAPPVVR